MQWLFIKILQFIHSYVCPPVFTEINFQKTIQRQDNDSLQTTLSSKLSEVMRDESTNPYSGMLHHEEKVDLVPANLELSAMEMSLVTAMSRESIMKNYLMS